MNERHNLALILFAGEIIRFTALFMVLSPAATLNDGGLARQFILAFAAPQSLFLFLSFLAWRSLNNQSGYLRLYTAGKFISGAALSARLGFSLEMIFESFPVVNPDNRRFLMVAAAIAATDILSTIIAGLSLIRRKRRSLATAAKESHAMMENNLDDQGGQ